MVKKAQRETKEEKEAKSRERRLVWFCLILGLLSCGFEGLLYLRNTPSQIPWVGGPAYFSFGIVLIAAAIGPFIARRLGWAFRYLPFKVGQNIPPPPSQDSEPS
ncbi:hypothetical protein [Leptospira andrefontaineae]|uniref:Uncharacterized protein n=1 Tax=Leptospira andrefontaineae TaxID=2484976 RepID=A0A4R9GY52_9LEPT|nr:hypothetical protein [Leptospira andrefontaineae]TGK36268.1 hypothetical protein EHO65_18380 [Leptospira andrefontaineae]